MTARPGEPRQPPFLLRREEGRTTVWTRALGSPPEVHGERTRSSGGAVYRLWEPGRSKLGAALVKGWKGPLPAEGERWLYLGAASGTTASHVADLVGERGSVFAVEKSPRPFVKLLAIAERYPNLFPVLADARDPDSYAGEVPPVDGLYLDVAQPDQVAIAEANGRLYLRGGGRLLLVLKTASLGRGAEPLAYAEAAVRHLSRSFRLEVPFSLEPFHRRHYLIGGRATPTLFEEEGAAATPSRRAARRS